MTPFAVGLEYIQLTGRYEGGDTTENHPIQFSEREWKWNIPTCYTECDMKGWVGLYELCRLGADRVVDSISVSSYEDVRRLVS